MPDSVQTVVEAEIKKFDITEAAIEKMKAEFSPLAIAGIDDRDGYKKVHEARMKVAGIRGDVEKRRVILKGPFLEGGRKIDMEAGRITDKLLPIEKDLKAKEQIIDEERERIKEEERVKEEARIKARFDKLQSVEAYLDLGVIKEMSDEGFDGYYEARKADYEKAVAVRALIQKEAKEKQEAEELKRKQETEENARIAKENREKQAALDAKEAELKAKEEALEKKAEEAEPTPTPVRPVTPPPALVRPTQTYAKNPEPIHLSEILTALSSAGYHNNQRPLVEDPNFIALRKMAKGLIPVIL